MSKAEGTGGPLVSVVAVNCDAPDWIKLFVLSVRKFTADVAHEILVVDNGSLEVNKLWLRAQSDVRLIELPTIELFHAGGMDLATREARGRYVCILDSDAHVQRAGWVADLIALYHANEKTRLVGVVGPIHKPLHPPLFFFERDFILDNGISWRHKPSEDRPRDTDTAQQAYWDVLALGFEVVRLFKGPKVYQGISWYDQIWINDKPTIGHMWYGTRFQESNSARTKAELDGIKLADHLARKAAFMAEPFVQAILAEDGANV
jgi:GT2 family glycosyltransferase